MRFLRPILAASILLAPAFAVARLADNTIPSPQTVRESTGTLPAAFSAAIDAPALAPGTPALRVLKENFARGPSLPVKLRIDTYAGLANEGYRLRLAPTGIEATGADEAGLFYAMQTLRQLAALDAAGIPAGEIDDAPAFAIRGFMHDTGRNFRPIAALKADLDKFAEYKLNTFHWHLTDNPAWRIECKAYPQLNDKRFRTAGRDPEATYSYDDIRGLIRYAKARHIRVIPELDMPGHSEYFAKTFGFGMGDPRAIPILKKLIAEFCAEIPKEDCPIIHIGSDEVHIKDPKGFIREIASAVEAEGRTPMIWNPGLPNDGRCIAQLWAEPGSGRLGKEPCAGIVDSSLGYLNAHPTSRTLLGYFFLRTCGLSRGDATHLGGIACLWPDVRVDDKTLIPAMNPQWPATLAFAENTWRGRPEYPEAKRLAECAPRAGTAAYDDYAAFETKLANHRDTFFRGLAFPFVKNVRIPWRIAGPFVPDKDGRFPNGTPEDGPRENYTGADGKPLVSKALQGGETMLPAGGPDGVDSKAPGARVYAITKLVSDRPRTLRAFIGFESPARSNRQYGGIPKPGAWMGGAPGDIAAVLLNGRAVSPPAWKNPGQYFSASPTWGRPLGETPYEPEEFYWLREPSTLELKAGVNTLMMRIPCRQTIAGWQRGFAFMPVKRDASGRWVEDESVGFEAAP